MRRFAPLDPSGVGIYSCGPTVYAPQHLGNMRSQIVPDLLRRVLSAAGHRVTYVTNITDVGHLLADRDDTDDKMEVAAAELGEPAAVIAARYTSQWSIDRRRLGCLEPDVTPRATQHIEEQIALIRTLEERGHTYDLPGGLYFDVSTFPRYPDFAGLDLDALATSGRVDALVAKRHPADFALWKRTERGVRRQQEWDSPWGRGFPGWHIECSAMAVKYLGPNFDIRTRGVDHIGVHHSNEIAQSECALDVEPWVGTWMHVEFLDLSGRKISKSEGDLLLVDTLIDRGIDPLAFRYFCFQAHYRRQQAFSWDALTAAATAYRRLVALATEARRDDGGADHTAVGRYSTRFWSALADDLNSPRALAVVWEALRADELRGADRWRFLVDADRALGLGLADAVAPAPENGLSDRSDARVDRLVADRHTARIAGDYTTSDRLRDRLAAEHIQLIDTPDGTTWRRTDT